MLDRRMIEGTEEEVMKEVNVAFAGGGVSSVTGLGAFQRYVLEVEDIEVDSYSGASIGGLIAICLAAGKDCASIMLFLEENVEKFCIPIVGKYILERETNIFLDNLKFKDLPKRCEVSITPVSFKYKSADLSRAITSENCGEMTVGRVAALSASFPILFLPSIQEINGKKMLIIDGGIIANPPLNPDAKNIVFSFRRKKNDLFMQKRMKAEAESDLAFVVSTSTTTRGYSEDVVTAYVEGYVGHPKL